MHVLARHMPKVAFHIANQDASLPWLYSRRFQERNITSVDEVCRVSPEVVIAKCHGRSGRFYSPYKAISATHTQRYAAVMAESVLGAPAFRTMFHILGAAQDLDDLSCHATEITSTGMLGARSGVLGAV